MGSSKPIIGLAGGIGSGKSSLARSLEALGCVVIDSDRLSHEVLARPETMQILREWWGPAVARADGAPDRRKIAEIVFSRPAEKRRLEELLYPLIAGRRADIIQAVEQDPAVKAIVLDSPLLFESNLDRLCDAIVFVDASEERRLERVRGTRGWDAAELHRRESCQLPLEQKRARADYVIENEGPPGRLHSAATELLTEILTRLAAQPGRP